MHFGENQLFPGLFGLSPLATAHPSSFQPTLVRASTGCYTSFTLAMASSPGFGSTPGDLCALFRQLAFAAATPDGLTLPPKVTPRLIMQKARGHTAQKLPPGHRAPTACRHMVSGTISLSIQEYFSPFPHGTSSLSVTREYLALGGGPPRFLQDFTCPAVLGDRFTGVRGRFAYRAFTFCGWTFQNHSTTARICNSLTGLYPRQNRPTTPVVQRAQA